MKLSERTLQGLAKLVVGDARHFPYRTSSQITKFFKCCGLPFVHDGSTRAWWAHERLAELNLGATQSADLPSDDLCRVITELFDQDDFDDHNEAKQDASGSIADFASVEDALKALNKLIAKDGLAAYLDESSRCYLRSTASGFSSATLSQQSRPLSQEEIAQRKKLVRFLEAASEDDSSRKSLFPCSSASAFVVSAQLATRTSHSNSGRTCG